MKTPRCCLTSANFRGATLTLALSACGSGGTDPSVPLRVGTFVAVRAAGRPVGEWMRTGTDSARVVADTIWFRVDGQVRRRSEYVLEFGSTLGARVISRDAIVDARLTREGALQLGGFAARCPNSGDCALVEFGQFAGDSVVLVTTWAPSVRNVVFVRRGE